MKSIVICLPEDTKHYTQSEVCYIGEYNIDTKKYSSYNISLNDYKDQSPFSIQGNCLVYNKDLFDFNFEIPGRTYDIKTYMWLRSNKIDCEIDLYSYQRFYDNIPNFIKYIPVYKLDEICEEFIAGFLTSYTISIEEDDKFYSLYVEPAFNEIEAGGLQVDIDILKDYYPNKSIDSRLYSKFNLHTTTGRPSNSFNSINFVSLDKKNGVRKAFISRFSGGKIVDIDFDAFDLRIIASILLDESFDRGVHVHEVLAKQFYNKDEITKEEYENSKIKSFFILFGEKREDELPDFFTKVYLIRSALYDQYLEKGYISTPISKRKIKRNNLGDLSESKLFNYYVQALETEVSALIITRVLSMIRGMSSKIILYTYDSILIDAHPSELDFIKNKISKEVLPPNRIKIGNNYHDLRKEN